MSFPDVLAATAAAARGEMSLPCVPATATTPQNKLPSPGVPARAPLTEISSPCVKRWQPRRRTRRCSLTFRRCLLSCHWPRRRPLMSQRRTPRRGPRCHSPASQWGLQRGGLECRPSAPQRRPPHFYSLPGNTTKFPVALQTVQLCSSLLLLLTSPAAWFFSVVVI